MFKIGDIVNVVNTGHVYSTYMSMARKLGADLNPAEWERYYDKTAVRYNTIRQSKWRFGSVPSREGLYQILDFRKGDDYHTDICYLIEHKESRKQYIMSPSGLKLYRHRHKIVLDNDLFEI